MTKEYWLTESNCSVDDFSKICSTTTSSNTLKYCLSVDKNIPIYDSNYLRSLLVSNQNKFIIMQELGNTLLHGAGVFVLKGAYQNKNIIDDATASFQTIIGEEQKTKMQADHFAASGSNDRIWNSLEKICLLSPEEFINYYSNDMLHLASTAWCGPNYQVTSQVNVVHPGGLAQKPHRDYHLGFQENRIIEHYPSHVHQLSAALTLQGAIAHVDMPIESGTTKLLPYSQLYKPGYLAWRLDEFRHYFEENCVQLSLEKGDMIFFNPALFHAAGDNSTKSIARMVNLLQVSSTFGIALEHVNRQAMCKRLFPILKSKLCNDEISLKDAEYIIASSAYGYSFPTNLDLDPPINGLAPKTQQQIMREALVNRWETPDFFQALEQLSTQRGQ